jgi:hypothetical protein
LSLEKAQFNHADSLKISSTMIRPFFHNHKKGQFTVRYRQEQYSNDNTSNQENMDVRFIGKGRGWFQGVNISYYNDFIAFSVEPYWLSSVNDSSAVISRVGAFSVLNDNQIKPQGEFLNSGFREVQFYLHYKGLGVGISNASLWWGPGIHNSLTMSNNTVGFPHYTFGTIRELRLWKLGFNMRITLSKLNELESPNATYYSAITGLFSYHGNTGISFGFCRNYLSGGVDIGIPWEMNDAMNLILEDLYLEDKKDLYYTQNLGIPDAGVYNSDPWDQVLSAFVTIINPVSGFVAYFEVARGDHAVSKTDLLTVPDHDTVSMFGVRKYGFFNNPNLLLVFEYTRLLISFDHIYRSTGGFGGYEWYDYNTFEGRRWAAHSGYDSDDFLLMFGYLGDKWAFIPGFNYERHGVVNVRVPEVKMEFRLDTRYKYKGFWFNLYYEYQHEQHLGFTKDNVYLDEATGLRFTNTIMLGVEKTLIF